MDPLLHDVRQALRRFAAAPAFSLVAIVTFSVAVAATTAMFALVDAVLLRPLPFPEPERLVWAKGVFSRGDRAAVSPPDFLDYRASNEVFEELGASSIGGASMTIGGGEPESVGVTFTSSNFLAVLGFEPVLGRFCLESAAFDDDLVADLEDVALDLVLCGPRGIDAAIDLQNLDLLSHLGVSLVIARLSAVKTSLNLERVA